ncbi:GumC family protein [Pararhizobium haloflavum]|uniref:GumC family protein n=1 Tax=Pararhizobium haloflavum TaxID=2037914 RepID=UPI0012FFD3EB|nr:Wzz/FepE/Etk N-terminal domain-containing protein [Pararhizobium haloflavum]
MSNSAEARGDVDIDIMRLAAALWERRFMMIAITLAAGLIAFLFASSLAPVYRGESRVLIEEREAAITRAGEGLSRDAMLDEQAIASQVEVIRAADSIREVVRELDLASRAEFDPAAQPSIVNDIMVFLGAADDPLEEASIDRAVAAFREKLQVYQIQNSRVIAIEFSSEDPQLAAEVANALARVYLQIQSGAKLTSNSNATAWLEPEIADLRERVRTAEAKIADYRAESDLYLVAQNDTLVARQLSDIAGELAQVRSERADAEARAANARQALEAGRSVDTVSSVLDSGLIQRLREQQVALQSQIADLSTTLLGNHPRIRGLRAQLSAIDDQIAGEVRKALASLETNAEVARLREAELAGQLEVIKASSAQADAEGVELRALEREAAAERQLLETYLARYREAISRGDPNALPADARIIASAVPASEPYYPKVLPITIVVMVAALLIQMIIVLLAELFSGRALRPAAGELPVTAMATTGQASGNLHTALPAPLDAGQGTGAPAAAPRVDVADEDEEDFSPAAIAAILSARRAHLVAGLSPEGDRASVGMVYLARSLAAASKRVLLVDMTGSGAPGRMMLGTAQPAGITNLLCGGVTIAETIQADQESGADVIPLGNADPERAMRGASRLHMIIEAVGDAYDVVIVECGSTHIDSVVRMLGGADLNIVLSVIDPDEDLVPRELEALYRAGFDDALLMLAEDDGLGARRDSAA